jgi:hypothetical protein
MDCSNDGDHLIGRVGFLDGYHLLAHLRYHATTYSYHMTQGDGAPSKRTDLLQ